MSTSANGASLRCPRCQARPTVQNAVEIRPGVEYLTMRCISCGLVYDLQRASVIAKATLGSGPRANRV